MAGSRGGAPRSQGGAAAAEVARLQYPPVNVDRALFDGDVIKVGPLTVTAFLSPGHSPSTTTCYAVKDNGKDYRVFEFCCWEYPDDLTKRSIFQKPTCVTPSIIQQVLPVDIYLETGAYGWSGMLNQSDGTMAERMAKLKQTISRGSTVTFLKTSRRREKWNSRKSCTPWRHPIPRVGTGAWYYR